MAKICGVFSFAKKPSDEIEIRRSLQMLKRSEDEIASVRCEKNAGLGQLRPESDSAQSDLFFDETADKTFVAADAVLTNRAELAEKLGVSPTGEDARLILRAYRKWGERCPKHLTGDFAFAVWDDFNQKLFCARDHFGGSTFFYFHDGEKLVFASEAKGILSFGRVEKTFNRKKLGIFLLSEPHTYLTEESWFANIRALPAGASLTVDESGVKIRRYWKPTLRSKIKYKNETEVAEDFRALLFEVIGAHLGKKTSAASLLSGGLDSSAIVAVAAKILEKQNRMIDVFAGVLADEKDREYADERFYIDRFKAFENVRINYVSAPGKGAFSDLEELFENYDSPLITSRHYLYTAFSKAAHSLAARTLFDGAFGEFGATSHASGGLAELFGNFRWLRLFKELKARKNLYGESIVYNFRANVVNPFLPQFLVDLKNGRAGKNAYSETHPFREEFAENLRNSIDGGDRTRPRLSPDHRINQLEDVNFIHRKISESPSLHFGSEPVEIRYPLLDKRLVEFALAVPLEVKMKDGYTRRLIRTALGDILPPEIRRRTTKTPFSPDYLRRYNSQVGKVKEMLGTIRTSDPVREILDVEKLKNWANLPIANDERYTDNERVARDALPQAVYLIYFLRKFSEFRN